MRRRHEHRVPSGRTPGRPGALRLARALGLGLAVVCGATAPLALAGSSAAPPARKEGASPPAPQSPVGLDRLLQLPEGLEYAVERKAGATRGEWRERFRKAREELSSARDAVEETRTRLEGLGEDSEAWQLAPPGSNASTADAPLSYQLRLQLRRQREEVERAEKRLRDLEIEANLAGVPESWRR